MDLSKYRMTFDIHTHTVYSHGFLKPHGKGTIEENVRAAADKGLEAIAISDHGPGHLFYGVRRTQIPEMRREIERLKPLFPHMKIYLSVEANVVMNKGNCLDVRPGEFALYDFVIAGYHFGTRRGNMVGNFLESHGVATAGARKRLSEKNTEMMVDAVLKNKLKVLTHPGDKGEFDIGLVAKACAKQGTWMEISTWHDHMTVDEIKTAMKEDVKFIISSDAHTPERVGSFEGGLERALEAGLPIERIVNIAER